MRREDYPERQVCITGIGQTPAGRPSNRSPLQLTLDACLEAIADAGLSVDDIEGIICHPGKTPEGGGISPVGTVETMMALGIRPVWTNPSSHEGPGHMAAIFQGIMGRVRDGTATDARAREAGAKARPVAELGWQQVAHLAKAA